MLFNLFITFKISSAIHKILRNHKIAVEWKWSQKIVYKASYGRNESFNHSFISPTRRFCTPSRQNQIREWTWRDLINVTTSNNMQNVIICVIYHKFFVVVVDVSWELESE